jgi:hypothetical protein
MAAKAFAYVYVASTAAGGGWFGLCLSRDYIQSCQPSPTLAKKALLHGGFVGAGIVLGPIIPPVLLVARALDG